MSDADQERSRPVKRFEHTPRWLRGVHWEWVMNAMLLLIALTIIGQTLYFKGQADEQKRCLSDQITHLTRALTARQVPVEIERQATRDLIFGAINSNGDPATGQQLADAYEKSIAHADELRKRNPIPEYPTGVCGT